MGVDDYLAKPYSPQELVARVERLVNRQAAKDCAPSQSNALRGDLEQVSLPTVLSMLELERKTGVLLVVGARTARLYVREGRPLALETEESPGKDSMQIAVELMGWQTGMFEFAPQDVYRNDALETSMQGMLMEAARLTDEANRDD